ncbi:MAG: hypothetical protein N2578_02265 [Bdellovibrionaceae bacterium]|nr:hypothetical protein [Pseudobdellovibrionaceae bacterium]
MVPVSGDFLTFMRSNPRWSWAWFAHNRASYGKAMEELISASGVVAGDLKPDNIDLVWDEEAKKFSLGLIDLDDGGRGSFLGDLFHTLVYNEIWHTPIPFGEAVEFYLKGLRNQSHPIDFSRIHPIDHERRLRKHAQSLQRMASDESYFFKELKLVPVDALKGENRKIYEMSWPQIRDFASRFGSVIRHGVRVKDSGGSAYIPRFTLLLRGDSDFRLIEFKFLPDPAVAVYEPSQPPHRERIDELVLHYGLGGPIRSTVGVLQTRAGDFLVRYRRVDYLDGGEPPRDHEEKKVHKEYARFMFYWLGSAHAKQSPEYVRLWLRNPENSIEALKQMTQDHLKDSRIQWAKLPSVQKTKD